MVTHVAEENALYLLRTSSSDPVPNVIMNHHQKSFQTVYNMTVFEEKIYFLLLYDVILAFSGISQN